MVMSEKKGRCKTKRSCYIKMIKIIKSLVKVKMCVHEICKV